MKPFLNSLYHKLFLLFLLCSVGTMFSCSEDEDDLVLTEKIRMTFTSPLPDSVALGESLTINISSNADRIEADFAKRQNPDSLFNKTVLSNNGDQFTLTVNVPDDGSWTGANLIKITAVKDGESTSVTRAVIFGHEDEEEEEPSTPVTLFLVGGSTEAGWEPTAAIPFTRREKDGIVYHDIYTFLAAGGGGFKILPTQVDWEGGYGLEEGELSNSGGASNLEVEEDGFYRITFIEDDEAPLGFTYEVVESSWGIIGAATPDGWNTDTDMEAPAWAITPGQLRSTYWQMSLNSGKMMTGL